MTSRRVRRSQQSNTIMRAVVQWRAETPLVLTDMFKPVPPRATPLIRVHTVGLNPHDVKMRDQGCFVSSYPVIMGADVAGTIEEGTSPISGFKAGDRVAYMASPLVPVENGLQEFTIVSGAYLIRLPQWMSFEAAATLGTNLTASWISLFSRQGLGLPIPSVETVDSTIPPSTGEGILILGGCSHIGFFAIQLASLAGLHPIVTTASFCDVREEDMRKLGATHVLDSQAPNLLLQIQKIFGNDLVYIFDTITDTSDPNANHLLAQEAISNTREGGKIVTSFRPRPREQWAKKNVEYETTFVLGINDNHPELARELVRRLPKWLDQGIIVTDEWEVAGGLEDANAVLTKLKGKESKRRQLVRVAQ